MEYKYDEESVNALLKWSENVQLPNELQLSEAENIVNLKQYVVANINDIKAHYPDEFYNPAITRMYRLKEKLEGESTTGDTEFHRVIRILLNKDYSVKLCVTPW